MSAYTFDVYIAVPYTSPYDWVREYRFHLATEYAKVLVERGLNPFSPITHSHPMAQHGLAGDWEFWKDIDERIMPACEELHVIQTELCHRSIGVDEEMNWFRDRLRPVLFVQPQTWEVLNHAAS